MIFEGTRKNMGMLTIGMGMELFQYHFVWIAWAMKINKVYIIDINPHSFLFSLKQFDINKIYFIKKQLISKILI